MGILMGRISWKNREVYLKLDGINWYDNYAEFIKKALHPNLSKSSLVIFLSVRARIDFHNVHEPCEREKLKFLDVVCNNTNYPKFL